MDEHPILFSGEMVRAILEGRKTQTRRVVAEQHLRLDGGGNPYIDIPDYEGKFDGAGIRRDMRCPYGQPGDRLWVRETWARMCRVADPWCWCESDEEREQNHYIEYRADTQAPYPGGWSAEDVRENEPAPKWRPSIYMRRADSRLALEIVRVSVERVQDISEEDALAEGCTGRYSDGIKGEWFSPVKEYRSLWERLNGKRGFGWDVNPWVWVIEFKRIEATEQRGKECQRCQIT